MNICFVGLDNLPVLAPEFSDRGVGGEQVQHTLLARALQKRGHSVSMVVYDYGQADQAVWQGVTAYKAYRPDAGIPVLRFVHPRWTGLWAALTRANADAYYASCAGMQLGLLAMFCRRRGRRYVFRIAHDTDCEPDKLLISYRRDKELYEYGLRHASGILAQSSRQQAAMRDNYGLDSRVAEMLVDPPGAPVPRDIDVLWVNNLRPFKRPELLLELAQMLPQLRFHMVGGPQPGFDGLYRTICDASQTLRNLTFHGRVPYKDVGALYARARVFVNTSDCEGFPNSYLQAWIRGTPVVAFFDPDCLIRTERLGETPTSLRQMVEVLSALLVDRERWEQASRRCSAYMDREYGEDRLLQPYLESLCGGQ